MFDDPSSSLGGRRVTFRMSDLADDLRQYLLDGSYSAFGKEVVASSEYP